MALEQTGIGILNIVVFVLTVTIPGYLWTLAFYPEKKSLERIERAAFSILFSITFLPMFVLLENTLLGIPVNFFSVLSTMLALAVVSILIYFIRTQRIGAPEFCYKFLPKIKKSDSVEIIPKL